MLEVDPTQLVALVDSQLTATELPSTMVVSCV
jgi:hypothetical protein